MRRLDAGTLSRMPSRWWRYQGPDRRGVTARLANPNTAKVAVWLVAGVVVLPVAGVGVVGLLTGVNPVAAATGAADTALVGFVASAVVLLLRWRLVGDAACVLLAAVALLAGLLFVPATHLGLDSATVVALRGASVVFMVGAALGALLLPEVLAGLRAIPLGAAVLAGALVMTFALAASSADARVVPGTGGFVVAAGIEGAVCAAVAASLVMRGVQSRQLLLAGAGAGLLSIAAGQVVRAVEATTRGGAWTALPDLFLLVGAVELLLVAVADLRTAFDVTVNHDLRGRRRWEAAETELDRARRIYRGRNHDVTSMLTAVDGSLFVLGRNDLLTAPQRDRLISAMHDQIHQLRTVLSGDADTPSAYDLSQLLGGLVAVHQSANLALEAEVEPALTVHGHPDRVTRIVNNLLANAATHARGASIVLRASRAHTADGEIVELTVADDGPGMTEAELEHAFESGWRGERAESVGGSGLGLAQCRTLAAAEGGEVSLAPADPLGRPGYRGLRARVRIPVRAAA